MYCSNCGKLNYGYRNDDGKIKYECDKCKVVFVRVQKGRRHDTIDMNKPYALAFLSLSEQHLSQKDFSEILADAWIRSENPNMDKNFAKNKLVAMFKKADKTILMDGEEKEQFDSLDDRVTIYRGVTSYNAKNIKALSWTTDYQTAEWFAHRFGEEGTVYEALISKEHILAFFNSRNESEVIVDPKHLMNITEAPEIDTGIIQTQ